MTLVAINRPEEETRKEGVIKVIGIDEIDLIEKTLAKVERKGLYATVLGTIIWYCRKHKFQEPSTFKEVCEKLGIPVK